MVSKVKVDAIESTTGSGTIALNNQFSGMTVASLPSTGTPPSIFAGGKVLQVVSAVVDGNITSTSTTFAGGPNLSITPASTSNKILVQYTGGRTGFAGSGGGDGAIKLYRTVSGGSATSVESTSRGISNFFGFGDFYGPTALQYLDSPSSTSSVTYTIYIARRSGSGTFSLSRDGSQSPTMTLMEIKG